MDDARLSQYIWGEGCHEMHPIDIVLIKNVLPFQRNA
jgi:hypothetical protein